MTGRVIAIATMMSVVMSMGEAMGFFWRVSAGYAAGLGTDRGGDDAS